MRGIPLRGQPGALLANPRCSTVLFWSSPPSSSKVPPFPLYSLSTRLTPFGGLPFQALMIHTLMILALAVLLGT